MKKTPEIKLIKKRITTYFLMIEDCEFSGSFLEGFLKELYGTSYADTLRGGVLSKKACELFKKIGLINVTSRKSIYVKDEKLRKKMYDQVSEFLGY